MTSASASRLCRASDWVTLAGFLALVASLAWFPLMSLDLGMHLTAGRYTVEHGIPETNVFSAIHRDYPMLQHEWAFQVAIHWIWEHGGPEALVVLRLVLALALALVLWRALPAGGRNPVAVLCLALGLFAASPRFTWRPEFISLLLAGGFLRVLVDFIEGRRDRLAWLPLLQIVWANVHGYFIVGLILLGSMCAGEALAARSGGGSRGRALRLLRIWLWTAAACLATPFLLKGAVYPLQQLFLLKSAGAAVTEMIGEMRPPWPLFASSWAVRASIPLLGLFVVSCALRGRKRRLHQGYVLAGLAVSLMALEAMRNIGLYGIVVGTLAAVQLADSAIRVPARVLAASILVVALLGTTFLVATNRLYIDEGQTRRFGHGMDRSVLDPPVRAFVDAHVPPGPVLNSFGIGSSFLWWFYPERLPFITGYSVAYPPEFFRDYWRLESGNLSEDYVAQRYGLEWAFVDIGLMPALRILENPAWHPVYMDGLALIAVRPLEKFAPLVESFDLRAELARGHIPGWEPTPLPTFWHRTYPRAEERLATLLLRSYPVAASRVLAHAVRVEPERTRWWVFLGFAELRSGRLDTARDSLRRAAALEPDSASVRTLRNALRRASLRRGSLRREREERLEPLEPGTLQDLLER